MRIFGPPEFSFSFDLQAQRKLAREEASEVLENLQQQGYHLQLRDDVLIEQMLALKGLRMSDVSALLRPAPFFAASQGYDLWQQLCRR